MLIRWMCGVTLKDRCKSEELRKRLNIEEISQMWLERVDWDGLVTWREKMRETSMQKYGCTGKCWKEKTKEEVEECFGRTI